MMINFELNDSERQALLQLLDVAAKAGGIQVAKAVSHFVDRIQEAVSEAAKPAPARSPQEALSSA